MRVAVCVSAVGMLLVISAPARGFADQGTALTAPTGSAPAAAPADDDTAPAAPDEVAAERARRLAEWDEPREQARRLLEEGKPSEAEDQARIVLAIEQNVLGNDDPELISTLNLIAQCQEAQEAWDDASNTHEDVLARSTAAYGEADYRVVDARLAVEGLSHRRTLTAAQRRELTEADSFELQVLELHGQGNPTEAIPIAEQVLKTRRALLGERHPDFSTSLNNLAALYKLQDDYSRAEPLYWRALEINREVLGEHHPLYALSLNNLAALREAQGDYARAEPLYWHALEIRKEVHGERHPDYAKSLNNLAGLYKSQGDYARAEPLYRQVLELRKEILGERHPDYATSLSNLADLYWFLGDYARVEPLYRQALEIRKEVLGERHRAYARSLNGLASVYQSQADYARAEPLYRQALEISKTVVGERHPAYARSLMNLAGLYRAQAEYARAEPLCRQALEINKAVLGERHPNYATNLHNLAFILSDMERSSEGFTLSMQAVELRAGTLEATAEVQSERQQLAMAESLTDYTHGMLSLGRLAGVGATELYPPLLRSEGQTFVRQRAIRHMRAAAQDSPDSTAAQTFAKLSDSARLLDQLAKLAPKPDEAAEHQQRLEQLTLEIERLQQTLSGLSAEFRQSQQAPVLAPADLAVRLPADAILIDLREYWQRFPHDAEDPTGRRKTQYVAFITRRAAEPQVVWLGPAEPINAAIVAWRERSGAGVSAVAGQMFRDLVWKKLEPHLEGATTVLVSPDGALNLASWGAFPGKEPGSYLIEDYAFVTVPVPSLLPQIIERTIDPTAEPSLLAIGDVDYWSDAGEIQIAAIDRSASAARGGDGLHWDELANTPIEINVIEQLFRNTFHADPLSALRRDLATEAQFRDQAPQARFLHVATHGYFAPVQLKSILSQTRDIDRATSLFQQQDVSGWHPGLLSGIVLAGANQPPQTDRDDGVLTALEVAELDLSNTELVVLSACETGLGQTAGGEGVLGLQRAFQLAGARTTVTSLWSVPDTTRALMIQFYKNRWQEKMSRVAALRQAQTHILRHGADDVRREARSRGMDPPKSDIDDNNRLAPNYWAAFVLSGDWR